MAKTGGGRNGAGRGETSPLPGASAAAVVSAATPPVAKIRIDKWLWQARFFKTRTLAAAVVSEGHVRLNSTPVSKPSREVGPGDVLTFPQGRNIRLIRIVGTGVRRGPASEAQTLFIDLDSPAMPPDALE